MICALFAMFSVSVSRTHVAPVLLASLSGSPGALQSPHILRKSSSGFSSWSASDIRLLHGQGHI
jgi:hypothetical protein